MALYADLELAVFSGERRCGTLAHNAAANAYTFTYAADWLVESDSFPLAPSLPLQPLPGETAEVHSRATRIFFDNLLPEGPRLEAAAQTRRISTANTAALLIAVGSETAGALRIALDRRASANPATSTLRPVSREDLSLRIRQRGEQPFEVWDGRFWGTLSGHQGKLAVYLDAAGGWHLADGPALSSTHIFKLESRNPALPGLLSNELMCMRLSDRLGLPTALVRLLHVPEPVLQITRFDRVAEGGTVRRLPVIDGCQAIGLPVQMKYEQSGGGASLQSLFDLLRAHADNPTNEQLDLLRWVILQVLIGNTDAHAKNLSFFVSHRGLSLAPAYDLVCGVLYASPNIDNTFAMSIGGATCPDEITPSAWRTFAEQTSLPPDLVLSELTDLATRTAALLPQVAHDAIAEGAVREIVMRITAMVQQECARQLQVAAH